jgi:hypothetical protein
MLFFWHSLPLTGWSTLSKRSQSKTLRCFTCQTSMTLSDSPWSCVPRPDAYSLDCESSKTALARQHLDFALKGKTRDNALPCSDRTSRCPVLSNSTEGQSLASNRSTSMPCHANSSIPSVIGERLAIEIGVASINDQFCEIRMSTRSR